MDWKVLGIEVTKDKKEITKAYRKKLVSVNPEDKPDEFKALRAAYEEALKLAEAENVPEEEKTPVGLWVDRLAELYGDFRSRIDLECWKQLLSEDICLALDTRPQIEEAMLRFFMDHYYIPQEVWRYLDQEFSFLERQNELYEHYPRDFVDYVILDGIRYGEILPYKMFIPGDSASDCEAYIKLYQAASRMPFEEASETLTKMAALQEHHPYGAALACRASISTGDHSLMGELMSLCDAYPEDVHLAMELANQCVQDENWAEAEKVCRRVLEINKGHFSAKWLLAKSLAEQGKYKEAVELIGDLMHACGGDNKQIYQLDQVRSEWNKLLIEQYEAELAKNPGSDELNFDAAWCCLQNHSIEEALSYAERITPGSPDDFSYYNLMGSLQYALGDYEKALEYREKLIEVIKALTPDGTEKTEKRMARLPEMMCSRATCLLNLGRESDASELYEEALKRAPGDAELLAQLIRVKFYLKDYARASELSEQLTKVLPSSYHGYFLLAQALFEQHRDRDAFDALSRAMDLDASDLSEYQLKLRILVRNGAFEQAHEVINFLHENGIKDDILVNWCEAQLTDLEEKDKEKALGQYKEIEKRLEAEKAEYDWMPKFYFQLALLTANVQDANQVNDREALIALLDKGLAEYPEDQECLDYKAWLLKKNGNIAEALELYHRLEKMPRRGLDVEQQLAELYYKDLKASADKSLHYYEILLSNDEENGDLHFYVGMCLMYLGKYEEAAGHFLREQELAPNDVDGYYRLSYIYELMGRYEDALHQAELAINVVADWEGNQSKYYLHKIQILRRMRRPQDAVAVVREIIGKYGYSDGNKLIFKIYIQFGLWEEAADVIKAWRRDKKEIAYWAVALVNLNLRKRDNLKARLNFANYSSKMSLYDFQDIEMIFSSMSGNTKDSVRIWKYRLDEKVKSGASDCSFELSNYVYALWRDGKQEEARRYAKQALEQLDGILKKHLCDAANHRGRRVKMLAILGEEAAARQELARMRSMPLCDYCAYSSCKDADIYAAEIEYILGNYEESLRLTLEGRRMWPDEEDFLMQENYLKKRGH